MPTAIFCNSSLPSCAVFAGRRLPKSWRIGTVHGWAGNPTLFAVGFLIINTAAMLKGAGKVINQAAGGTFGVNHIVLAMTATFIVYSFLGGLVASAWTDVLQGFLIIVLSFLLIPLGLGHRRRHGWNEVDFVALPIVAGDPHGVGIWTIVVFTLNGLIGIMAQLTFRPPSGRAKTRVPVVSASSMGTTSSACVPRVGIFLGLMVTVMVIRGSFGTRTLADPEDAFGFVCGHVLSLEVFAPC